MIIYSKNIINYLIVLAILSMLQGCTSLGPHFTCTYEGKKFKTYSIYRPFVGLSEYKGGYWGKWNRDIFLRYKSIGTYPGFEITFYKKFNHPADFEYKIIAKSRKTNDGQWEVYDGEIHIKKSNETSMRSQYLVNISGVDALKDVWIFSATIKRTYSKLPESKYIYPSLSTQMMYVYNVFYNGVGRAFDIYGEWVGADQYDPW